MEYSVDFENMVKSHQDKFIGYGNPNAKILIIVPKKDVEGIISFSAGRYNTQFIIATHSPFLLAIPNAKIYNLDECPVKESKMWELDNMREYYNLFKSYSDKFESNTTI